MYRRLLLTTVLSTGAVLVAATNPVSKWNELAVTASLTAGENAIVQSRTLAIVHVSIHDALNSINPRYERYAFQGDTNLAGNPEAAITMAGHDALVGALTFASTFGFGTPAKQAIAVAQADVERDAELNAIPAGLSKSIGIDIGRAAAAAILNLRSSDHAAEAVIPYTPGTTPGDWQPTPTPTPPSPAGVASYQPAVLPGWGLVTPFVLRRSTQFEPDGPPRLRSRRYARDYNEVKTLGAQFSNLRTEEQSRIAMFWYENASAIWSRFGRVIADTRALDLWQTARLLALTNLAMADAVIAGFQAKYEFNRWRPVTAIRAGDTDGNNLTLADPAWSTFLNTPAHPDYPSTHSVMAGAAAAVLRRFFHDDRITFTASSGVPFANLTRSFTSFSQAASENGDARVYAGIHTRSAVEDGTKQGTNIGRFVYLHSLRPSDLDDDDDDRD
jgi:hypothetical protein